MRRLAGLAALAVAVAVAGRAAARSNTQVHRTLPARPLEPSSRVATAATLTGDVTDDPATAGGNA